MVTLLSNKSCVLCNPHKVGAVLQVILDMSRAASMTDMRPNRGAMMIQVLQLFVREFFDQNPLSHLSIMLLRNGRAERLTDLSGSPVSLLLLLRAPSSLSFTTLSCVWLCVVLWCACLTGINIRDNNADPAVDACETCTSLHHTQPAGRL